MIAHLFLCTIIGMVYSVHQSTVYLKPSYQTGLSKDINDFIDLVPKDKFLALYNKYKNDPDIENLADFLKRDRVRNAVRVIFGFRQLIDFFKYLENHGVKITVQLNKLAESLGLPHWGHHKKLKNMLVSIANHGRRAMVRNKVTVRQFVSEFLDILPLNKMVSLVFNKFATSPDFQDLYRTINTMDYHVMHKEALASPQIRSVLHKLRERGINTNQIWNAVKVIFGWGFQREDNNEEGEDCEDNSQENQLKSLLEEDLQEFIALIPKERFYILLKNYSTNIIFQMGISYLFSRDIYHVLQILLQNDAVSDFYDFLGDNDVNFFEMVNKLKTQSSVGYWYNHLPDGDSEVNATSFSIVPFVDIAKEIAPTEEINTLSQKKLSTSEPYKQFHDKVIKLLTNDKIKDLFKNSRHEIYLSKFNSLGIDISKYLRFIFSLFGVDLKTDESDMTLTKDLFEFRKIIPQDQFVELFHKYKEDSNIWKIFTFLKSKIFLDVISFFETNNETQKLIQFLQKEHVPYRAFVIELFDSFGVNQWMQNYKYYCDHNSACKTKLNPNSENLSNFINETVKLVPVHKILVNTLKKIKSSPSFLKLFRFISKLNLPKLRSDILQDKQAKSFLVKLNMLGIITHNIWELLKKNFGWKDSDNSGILKTNTKDLLALVPKEKIIDVYRKYENDTDMVEIVKYLGSDSFYDVADLLFSFPEIRNIIEWIEDRGVPIIDSINQAARFIALHKVSVPRSFFVRHTQGWTHFMKELENLTPFKALQNQIQNKLKDSIQFQALCMKFSAIDYKYILRFINDHPEIRYMQHRLETMGVDFGKLIEYLTRLFDWV